MDNDMELTVDLWEMKVWEILPEPEAQSKVWTPSAAPKIRLCPLSFAIRHVASSTVG